MKNTKLFNHKKIAILGLGLENQALLDFLFAENKNYQITVCDYRSADQLGERYKKIKNKVVWKLGPLFNQGLYKFDIMFRSPGWPINCPGIQGALKYNKELSSPIKLFFDLSPTKNIIGVTGTKGKGTTSALIYDILKQAGKKVYLGGNIGIAPLGFLKKLKPSDWVVLELSSFQLEDMNRSPRLAVITNFYKEHLAAADPHNPNFHKTLAIYWQAKVNVFRWQESGDYLIANQNLKKKLSKTETSSRIIYFDKSELPSRLPGEHNKENIDAAAKVAQAAVGVRQAAIREAVGRFKGLEHRLELVKKINGVFYYNDSFATTPEATITALKSFDQPIILLAGGAEKKSSFGQLAKEIKKRVKFSILLKGEATPRLKKELFKNNFNKIEEIDNLAQALKLAKSIAKKEEIVLLSTACASFGLFRNYKERGELFKQEVFKLK